MKSDVATPSVEEKVGMALVKARVLSEPQLKTCLDYQRSLGGSIADVAAKLGFARPHDVAVALESSGAAAPTSSPKAGKKAPPAGSLRDEDHELATQLPPPYAIDPGALKKAGWEPTLRALLELLVQQGVVRAQDIDAIVKR